MNEVRSTNELAASPPRRGLELEVSKPIVLLQKKSKRQETSVFDGMRHARPVHDALKRRLRERQMAWPSAGAARSWILEGNLVGPSERANVSAVKLVRAFGGCLGTKRR